MASRQCSYCEAKAKKTSSLADQGWMAFVITIREGGERRRVHRRACPEHLANLRKDMAETLGGLEQG